MESISLIEQVVSVIACLHQLTNTRDSLEANWLLLPSKRAAQLAGQAALLDELSNSRIFSKTTFGDPPFCKNAST